MKFALVSQDKSHGVRFWMNPESTDATSFMNWVNVWQGYHFCFDKLREDMSVLKDFDVVMMSGNPYNFKDIISIANYLKETQAISMFYPEGSTQLYDNSINGFHAAIYDAWNACDVLSIVEEDKASYYKAFIRSNTIVRFIHVPLREEMEQGNFLIPYIHKKKNLAMVYGDNNPNHPLIAIAAAVQSGMEIAGVDIDRGKIKDIANLFPGVLFHSSSKLAQYPFLRALSRCFLQFYPTEWIGTARQQIACAVTGTPCIGNHDSHTQRRLFPELGCDIYDIDRMVYFAEKLKDSRFYSEVARKAFEGVQFYSLANTKERFMHAVEDARKIKNRISVPVQEVAS